MQAGAILLELSHLSRTFARSGGVMGKSLSVKAVDDVSLSLARGKTLGLVGESGSGKSTLAKMVVHLLAPSSGNVLLGGQPIYADAGKKPDAKFLKSLPSRLQMVFQDPYSSLNPRLKIGYSIAEPLICAGVPRKESAARVAELLASVGLKNNDASRYPHEFSGGQRQRIALARALAPRPDIIVCDEPVSSLDASVQAQVLNLLKDSQDALGLTYLFISHDLTVVSHMSDQVAVMYLGRIVELGDTDQIFSQPLHPYTAVLLEAASGRKKEAASGHKKELALEPSFHKKVTSETDKKAELEFTFHNEVASNAKNKPDPACQEATEQHFGLPFSENLTLQSHASTISGQLNLHGCAFAPRCPKVQADCLRYTPELEFKKTHQVSCFYPL